MSDTSNPDQSNGEIKEAAGEITGDEELQEQGQNEQQAGDVKEAVGDAVDDVIKD